ncbi:hypothetical protein ACFS5L_43225 [Streptomyces phyllanthi]|uniref:Sensor domain-containing protein n=1 Tax=Streptomyces phyllanthi TaxID=1803180 RepID=A0A5N8WEX1_9ACTN|nr:hypothetical protein [Streptomyces phyllanthi]MPY46041.1 hypothetical protein [Streptomyces phyllanthi]
MKRSAYVIGAALLALVACSAEGKTETGTKTEESTEESTSAKAGKQDRAVPLSSPYTAKQLKAALLTTAETPSGFEVSHTTAAGPSSPPAEASETVRPTECAVLRNPHTKAQAEAVNARAQLHRPSEGLDLHRMALVGWSETDAKARMAALRSALETCGAIEFENVGSKGPRQAVFRAEKAPALGDETLRYSLNSASFYQNFTVVRVQGLITIVTADTVFGPGLTAERREELTPEPEEELVRAQVAKVERNLR